MASETRSDIHDYAQKAADIAGAAAERGGTLGSAAAGIAERAQRAASAAAETAQRAGTQANELAGEAYRRGQDAAQRLGEQVEQQPLLGLLVAFAIGYSLAYLVHRR